MFPSVITTFINQQFNALHMPSYNARHGITIKHFSLYVITAAITSHVNFANVQMHGAHKLKHLIVLGVRRLRQARRLTYHAVLVTLYCVNQKFCLCLHSRITYMSFGENAFVGHSKRRDIVSFVVLGWTNDVCLMFSLRQRLTPAKKNTGIRSGADCCLDFTKLFNWDGFLLASSAYWPWQCVNVPQLTKSILIQLVRWCFLHRDAILGTTIVQYSFEYVYDFSLSPISKYRKEKNI